MFRTLAVSILSIVLLGSTLGVAQASGGGGHNQGFSARKVDKLYEEGKSYFKAKVNNGASLKYCVQSGDELKKLSKRSLKPLRKSNEQAFAASLYNCDTPDQTILAVVGQDKMSAIVHYLNKRYKLKLSGNS